MTAFELEQEIIAKGGDIAAIRQAWMEVSDEKGWPKTEIGLKRYLERCQTTGRFPSRSKSRSFDTQKPKDPDGWMEWVGETFGKDCNGYRVKRAFCDASPDTQKQFLDAQSAKA